MRPQKVVSSQKERPSARDSSRSQLEQCCVSMRRIATSSQPSGVQALRQAEKDCFHFSLDLMSRPKFCGASVLFSPCPPISPVSEEADQMRLAPGLNPFGMHGPDMSGVLFTLVSKNSHQPVSRQQQMIGQRVSMACGGMTLWSSPEARWSLDALHSMVNGSFWHGAPHLPLRDSIELYLRFCWGLMI